MHIMSECWQNYHTALILKKNSPLTQILEEKILRIIGKTSNLKYFVQVCLTKASTLTEAGLIEKWISDEMDRVALKDKFRKTSITSVKRLGFGHFQSFPVFQGICLLISCFAFLFEYFSRRSLPQSFIE
jgi:hypothetical protein